MAVAQSDVIVVGLGPVGGTLAALLAKWDLSVLVVDREGAPVAAPRAVAFDCEVMRVFQQIGIAESLQRKARRMRYYDFVAADGRTLMHFDLGEAGLGGWANAYNIHQPDLEIELRSRLSSEPSVQVLEGQALQSITRNDEQGVTVAVTDSAGVTREVRARFLVGADGSASTVRQLIGGTLFDFGFEEPWLVVDTLMTDETGLRPHAVQVCDPARPTSVIPSSPGRRRWEFMMLEGENAEDVLRDEFIAGLLKTDGRRYELVRKAVYRFHGVVAERWRSGSVFLAGDAAHQMPPFLGQGMCAGVRDAANLAWKLALVLRAGADPRLLDTYQMERDPHVRAVIERAIAMGKVVCIQNPDAARDRDAAMLAAQARGEPPPADSNIPDLSAGPGCFRASARAGEIFPQPWVRDRSGAEVRFDELIGNRACLITRSPARFALPRDVAALQIDADFSDDGSSRRWLDAADAPAVLVRPDRYVFGIGQPWELVDGYLEASARAQLPGSQP